MTDTTAANNNVRHIDAVASMVFACFWILLTVWSRWSAGAQAPDTIAGLSQQAAIAVGVGLCAATIILARTTETCTSNDGDGRWLVAILFAFVASALVARGQIAVSDVGSVLFAVGGLDRLARRKSGMATWLLLGAACASSGLAIGLVIAAVVSRVEVGGRLRFLVTVSAVGAVIGLLINQVFDRPWVASLAISSKLSRVGPSYLWTLSAWWLDMVTPLLALALLAIANRLYGDQGQTSSGDQDDRFKQLLLIWLAINTAAGVAFPRILIEHGLMHVLPAFLLVPSGWCVFRALPFDRRNWSLSAFSIACYGFMVLLLWAPVWEAGKIILIALVHP